MREKNFPKLFVTDLDGTLLKDNDDISPADLEALGRINKLGCGIVAATGRPYGLIPACVKNLPGLDYVISANGAVLYDNSTGVRILENYLDKNTAMAIYEETIGRGGGVDLYFADQYISEDRSREILGCFMKISDEIRERETELFTTVLSAKSYLLSKAEPIIKLVCFFRTARECRTVLKKLRQQSHITAVTLFGYEIEVTSKSATKGNALAFIRKLRGIAKDEVIAVGDNENDLSLRDEAGCFVVMGNAGKHIKALADYISAAANEDGVAQAINTLIFGMI